jgi:hypothetical protein
MIWDNDEGASVAKFAKKKLELVNSKKAGGAGVLLKREHIEFDSDDEYQELGEKETPEENAEEPAPMSDLDYMRSKMKQTFDGEKEKDTDQESGQPQKRKKTSSHEGAAKKAKTSPPDDEAGAPVPATAQLPEDTPVEAKRKAFAAKGSALTPDLIADSGIFHVTERPTLSPQPAF